MGTGGHVVLGVFEALRHGKVVAFAWSGATQRVLARATGHLHQGVVGRDTGVRQVTGKT